MFIDPKTLVPKLPQPRDLQPFPNTLSMAYSGHTGRVRSISPHPGACRHNSGVLGARRSIWLLTVSFDVSVAVWLPAGSSLCFCTDVCAFVAQYNQGKHSRTSLEMVLTVRHVLCLHAADVLCLCTGGQWLASGSDDGSMRVWEVATGRCCCSWQLGEPVVCVSWCPNPKVQLLAAAVGSKVVLLPFGLAGDEVEEAAKAACQVRALCALGFVFWFGGVAD